MSEEAEEGSQLPIKGQGCCRRGEGGKGTIRLKGEKELEGGEGGRIIEEGKETSSVPRCY